jgi:hypothetical protein
MGTIAPDIDDFVEHTTGNVLEIGMDRGEGSSLALITLAQKRKVKYVGVDIIENTQWLQWQGQELDECEFHVCTGESFAESTEDTFGIVYLDNFDWDYWATEYNARMGLRLPGNCMEGLKEQYEEHYPDLKDFSNEQSQIAHLTQIKLLNLDDNCVVICDDTWFDILEGQWMGKCGAVVTYLQTEGFEVVCKRVQTAKQNPNGKTGYVIISRGHNEN